MVFHTLLGIWKQSDDSVFLLSCLWWSFADGMEVDFVEEILDLKSASNHV